MFAELTVRFVVLTATQVCRVDDVCRVDGVCRVGRVATFTRLDLYRAQTYF